MAKPTNPSNSNGDVELRKDVQKIVAKTNPYIIFCANHNFLWPENVNLVDELMHLIQSERTQAATEMLDNLDDIANKPWRAMRYLAEMFEGLPGDYNAECAREYRKLEAFYSNGGSKKIDELLADSDFNVNYPEILQRLSNPEQPKEDL